TGEPAAAEALCREALARDGLQAEAVALLGGQLGALLMHGGRMEGAEASLTAAIDALAATGSATPALANWLMNRAVVRM
ncbi:hypothetical protein, partial [Microbacterium sp. GbtcB4]|uniref:hypothetical protein n=1 Tax=Microbacterium sp. GbtcB4 TaxID=2824749 RepID=UPI001C2F9B63